MLEGSAPASGGDQDAAKHPTSLTLTTIQTNMSVVFRLKNPAPLPNGFRVKQFNEKNVSIFVGKSLKKMDQWSGNPIHHLAFLDESAMGTLVQRGIITSHNSPKENAEWWL